MAIKRFGGTNPAFFLLPPSSRRFIHRTFGDRHRSVRSALNLNKAPHQGEGFVKLPPFIPRFLISRVHVPRGRLVNTFIIVARAWIKR